MDHHTEMLNAAMVPLTSAELKAQLQRSVVLAALENIMRLDRDRALRKEVRRRYLELTGGANDNG